MYRQNPRKKGLINGAEMRLIVAISTLLLSAGMLASRPEQCGISVVLIGSTGDLAKRYLWPALYHVSTMKTIACELLMFGGVRKLVADDNHMWSVVSTNIYCREKSNESCSESHTSFRQSVHFVQLGSENDYKLLPTNIKNVYNDLNLTERGRIFYLSVPPSAYPSIIKSVDQYARPESGSWLKVVLEKPFGQDLVSAKHLASEVSEHLTEEEVYRVDHYLGKFGVQQILPFRMTNRERLSAIWNKDHIERIEIAMKETLDVKGRSLFYDKYGVIRDVVQNHLTEMLCHLIMSLPRNEEDISSAKLESLSRIYSPRLHHTLLGQYEGYTDDLLKDGVISSLTNVSHTPTFASVVLFSRDPNWSHVPFFLVSGKQLTERTAYAKVVFKQHSFNFVHPQGRCGCQSHVTFLVQDEKHAKPGIVVSNIPPVDLQMPAARNGNEFVYMSDSSSSDSCTGTVYYFPQHDVEPNAYVSLIEAVLNGRKEYFVATETLLESWRIWTPLLHEIEQANTSLHLPIYTRDDDLYDLGFFLDGTRIVSSSSIHINQGFSQREALVDSHWSQQPERFELHSNEHSVRWTDLLDQQVIVANRFKLVSFIADELYRSACVAVDQRGMWHVALPGGRTPVLLYETIALDYHLLFPWKHVHIWQTDERCVKRGNEESNIWLLSELLLSQVPVPFQHFHPLPIHLEKGVCHSEDKGFAYYERQLTDHGLQLDFILLGVGKDGHVASLFPNEAVISAVGRLVQTVTLNSTYPVATHKRMTLSYEAIIEAKKIAVFITGEGKEELIQRVDNCMRGGDSDCDVIPVLKLIRMAKKGQLSIFIDSQLVNL